MELSEGYKQTEVGVIPDDWNVKSLKKISPSQSVGLVINPSSYFDDDGTVPMLVGSNIKENSISWESANRISDASNKLIPASRLTAGDLVTIRVGEPGITAVVPLELDGCNCASVMIVRKSHNFDSNWLCYVMNSRVGLSQIEHVQYGTAQKQFNIKDAVNFLYPTPSLAEQTAIANALSDADTLIQSLTRLIAKKRQIKQGAMQTLLNPYENGRLKAGWVVKKLGKVCDIRKGQLVTSSTKIDGDIPVIAGGKKPAYFHNKQNREGKTITVSGSGANAGYIAFHDYPIFASDCSTINESEDYSIEYIYFLLQEMQEKLYKMQTGGAQPHIHPRDLNPIKIPLPALQEQTRIATNLSDMDAEITALETKHTKAKQIKQGMMQNLLTGRIRLL